LKPNAQKAAPKIKKRIK